VARPRVLHRCGLRRTGFPPAGARLGTELRLGDRRAEPPTGEAETVRVEERIGLGAWGDEERIGVGGWKGEI
jgi:hypothetical protein